MNADNSQVSLVLDEDQLSILQDVVQDPFLRDKIVEARLRLHTRLHWSQLQAAVSCYAAHLDELAIISVTPTLVEGKFYGQPFSVRDPDPVLVEGLRRWRVEREALRSSSAMATLLLEQRQELSEKVQSLTTELSSLQKQQGQTVDLQPFLDRATGELSHAHAVLDDLDIPMGPLAFRVRFAAERGLHGQPE